MDVKDPIRMTLSLSEAVIDQYLNDLSDADLLVRPVDGMNHIAWQLGHLIATERWCIELIRPGVSPPLPEGFDEGHGRDRFTVDDPSKFLPRDRYRELWKAQRKATLEALDATPVEDLDRADPENFPGFAPSVGALFNMIGDHALMHCGQFVAVRRKLGKPITG